MEKISVLETFRKISERFTDAILLVFITFPLMFISITMPFCNGWNEGSMAGSCDPVFLEGVYNMIMSMGLFLSFTIFFAPLVLGAVVISLVAKILKYTQGYRPRTVKAVIWETITIIPLLAVIYFSGLFLGIL